jgi:hypothetical protein
MKEDAESITRSAVCRLWQIYKLQILAVAHTTPFWINEDRFHTVWDIGNVFIGPSFSDRCSIRSLIDNTWCYNCNNGSNRNI